ncbi:unnamed protein product [Ceratitis capitata]|uniref:(Mediterranean fruit fly) hypothetical protein n=1 Tax=Ceratitis capitata TaxID=7213 RepID=A0A811U438_CERCA|nr:unnamed protein product [Ceratitis capitata]
MHTAHRTPHTARLPLHGCEVEGEKTRKLVTSATDRSSVGRRSIAWTTIKLKLIKRFVAVNSTPTCVRTRGDFYLLRATTASPLADVAPHSSSRSSSSSRASSVAAIFFSSFFRHTHTLVGIYACTYHCRAIIQLIEQFTLCPHAAYKQ